MTAARRSNANAAAKRAVGWTIFTVGVLWAIYLMATATTGPVDPTEVRAPQSQTTVVFNTSMIVFREGLEAILIFAAILASFQGANKGRRKPVVFGGVISFAATVATWFLVVAFLDAASPLGPKLEAITGFVAIAVLLVVLNWFVHKVYWNNWIARHHRQRRRLLERAGIGATAGLVALGFTSVYREGVEVVLFLQNLQLRAGSGVVLEGVAIGLGATAIVGYITFWLEQRLPYKRMLIATGLLIVAVMIVMVGGTARTFIDLGWLPGHQTPFQVPEWLGSWLEIYSYWETIGAQLAATVFVLGCYFLAEYIRVIRPQRRGMQGAVRAVKPPAPLQGAGAHPFNTQRIPDLVARRLPVTPRTPPGGETARSRIIG